MIKKINNFINGRFENSTSKTIPVWNPQNGEKLTEVTCSSKKELNPFDSIVHPGVLSFG